MRKVEVETLSSIDVEVETVVDSGDVRVRRPVRSVERVSGDGEFGGDVECDGGVELDENDLMRSETTSEDETVRCEELSTRKILYRSVQV